MTDAEAPLPELQDQTVSWAVIDDLLADIATSARLFSMLIKSDRERMAGGAELDLGRARRALDAGKAVQLRYLFEGTEWWDTLIPVGEGVRIVRVEQAGADLSGPDPPPPGGRGRAGPR